MPLSVFPELVGVNWGTRVSPSFNNSIARSASGNEIRTNLQDQPLWDFELSYDFVRNGRDGAPDLRRIQEFFLTCLGSFTPFLFKAPEVPYQSGTVLGVGDGTTTDFTLLRYVGSFSETIGGIEAETDVLVYLNGVPTAASEYSLIDHRTIRFTTPPAALVQVSGD